MRWSQDQQSGCGAAGSALPWGGRGRKFKSCHSDQMGNFLVAHFSLYNKVLAILALFQNAQNGCLLRRVFKGVTQFATQIV